MLEMVLDKQVLFVLMGILTILGVVSKCVANVALNRLVRAAGNMNKTTHSFIRLVRAKFEHACMVSDKVENVSVFVDKYLYEYKVAGFHLHSWRRMEKAASGLCLIVGVAGALLEYSVHGMGDAVIRTGAAGGILAVLIYLFHLTTDENYRLEAAKNYMVDYLENVCLHKYEKTNQKELKVMTPDVPAAEFGVVPEERDDIREESGWELLNEERGTKRVAAAKDHAGDSRPRETSKPSQEVPGTRRTPEVQEPSAPVPQEAPGASPQIQAARIGEMQKNAKKQSESDNRTELGRDALIRQILEEFMA